MAESVSVERQGSQLYRLATASAIRFVRRNPLGGIGAAIVVVVGIVAATAPWIAPYDPLEIPPGLGVTAPSGAHWLGTDPLGRDILSRVMYGARVSLSIGISAVVVGQVVGTLLGLVAGYFGGKLDLVVMRFIDGLMAFPPLIFALAIVVVLGTSAFSATVALAVLQLPRATRVVRSVVLRTRNIEFITAATAIGCSYVRILFVHILPQCLAPIVVLVSVELPHLIIVEATLSFLGVGVPEPQPSWGSMIAGAGRTYLELAPWIALAPGVAMALTVLGFNLLGDTLRDILDPRMRGSRAR